MKIIVIGAVAAGTSAAAKARRMMPEADIVVYEKNAFISYASCSMPYYIGPTIERFEDIVPRTPESFGESRGVNIKTRHEVLKICHQDKTIVVRDPEGREFVDSYDKLVLATGARAFMLPIPGVDLPHVFPLRRVEDMLAIDAFIDEESPKRAVIIGSGFIGIEMAENLHERGLHVTMLEASSQISNNLDSEIAKKVQDVLTSHAIDVFLSSAAEAITEEKVQVKEGPEFEADLVIMAVGVRPNIELAQEDGLAIGQTKAIAVNSWLQTSDPDIYACGDCIETPHRILGRPVYIPLGTTANKTGRIVGENVVGGKAEYEGILGTSIYKVFDYAVGQTGLTEKAAIQEGYDVMTTLIEGQSRSRHFGGGELTLKAVADRQSGRLLGVQAFGQDGVDKRVDVIATALTFGAHIDDLTQLDLAFAPPFSGSRDQIHYIGMNLEKKLRKE